MFNIFKTYVSPSYKEIITQGGKKKRRASDFEAISMFMIYVAVCLVASLYYRIRYFSLFKNVNPIFLKYRDAFGFWLLTGNWHKAFEGYFFTKVDIKSPSLEIGFYSGSVSALHFEGKKFDFGSEYVYQIGKKGMETFKLWDHIYCEELTSLAAKDNSFQTICLVHIVDHLEQLDPAFRELGRVLNKGGSLYFSGYCEHAMRPNLVWRLLSLFSNDLAQRYSDALSRRRKLWNFWSQDQWKTFLAKHNFDLVEFHYMGAGGGQPYIAYFLHYLLFYKGCFENKFFLKKGFVKIFQPLFYFFFMSIGYPIFHKIQEKRQKWSTDFFIVASRS